MVPAVPHHRHQSSLEGVIDFSAEEPLQPHRRSEARRKFYRILDHFEVDTSRENLGPYVRPRLIRYTYEYALSEEARDRFLRAFFQAIELPIDGGDDVDPESLRSAVTGFADYLLDNFFLPRESTTSVDFFFKKKSDACRRSTLRPLTRSSESYIPKNSPAHSVISFRN